MPRTPSKARATRTKSNGKKSEGPTAGEFAMNKSRAARAAVDAGYEKPAEAVAYIKGIYGVDMSPQHFSAVKSRYKSEGAPKGRRGRKPKAVNGILAAPKRSRRSANGHTD